MMKRSLTPAWEYCLSRCVWFYRVLLSRGVLLLRVRWCMLFSAFLFVVELSNLSIRSWRIVCHFLKYTFPVLFSSRHILKGLCHLFVMVL